MIRTVALFEFLSTIKRKSYYLVTLGMPLFVVLYAGLIGVIGAISVSGELASLSLPVGILDDSAILVGPGGALHDVKPGATFTANLPREEAEQEVKERLKAIDMDEAVGALDAINLSIARQAFVRFDSIEAARAALAAESIRVVARIPIGFIESGQIETYVKERKLFSAAASVDSVERLLVREILRQNKLSDEAIRRVQSRAATVEHEIGPTGDFVAVDIWSKALSLGFPLGVSVLLLIALMMNANLLLASVAEEKENRVIEVLLSSVSAEQLLFGKVIGLVAAGILQIIVWIGMASVVPVLTMSLVQRAIAFEVSVPQIALGVLFILMGFVFYGCLLAGIGSLGSTFKDSQQLTVIVILFPVVPMMITPAFLNNPNGIIARVLSWIPLCSPSAMMLRLGVAKVPQWEVAASLAILAVSIWLAVKFSARLFRVGTLHYGKFPGFRNLWNALSQPA